MLDNGSPVLIGADRKENGKRHGHFWVIDGYRLQNQVGSNHHVYGQRYLMHCNWGWGGVANGYYVSKVFDLRTGAEEMDPCDTDTSTMPRHYHYAYRTVTYTNPNR